MILKSYDQHRRIEKLLKSGMAIITKDNILKDCDNYWEIYDMLNSQTVYILKSVTEKWVKYYKKP